MSKKEEKELVNKCASILFKDLQSHKTDNERCYRLLSEPKKNDSKIHIKNLNISNLAKRIYTENLLDRVGITLNKNTVPNETRSPFVTSGVRIGTAAVTTRGFKEEDMVVIAEIIDEAIKNRENDEALEKLKAKVKALCDKYPLYE